MASTITHITAIHSISALLAGSPPSFGAMGDDITSVEQFLNRVPIIFSDPIPKPVTVFSVVSVINEEFIYLSSIDGAIASTPPNPISPMVRKRPIRTHKQKLQTFLGIDLRPNCWFILLKLSWFVSVLNVNFL
jgi:hypothetical protein